MLDINLINHFILCWFLSHPNCSFLCLQNTTNLHYLPWFLHLEAFKDKKNKKRNLLEIGQGNEIKSCVARTLRKCWCIRIGSSKNVLLLEDKTRTKWHFLGVRATQINSCKLSMLLKLFKKYCHTRVKSLKMHYILETQHTPGDIFETSEQHRLWHPRGSTMKVAKWIGCWNWNKP